MEKLKLENLKFLSLPLAVLLITTILFVVSLKLFSDRLAIEQSDLTQAQKEQTVLSQKLNALQNIGDIVNKVQSISSVLPEENPSFVEISQVKRYIQDAGLTLASIQIGQEITDSQGISHTNVNFDVEGSSLTVFLLVDKLKIAAPLTTGSNITINQKGGTSSTSFTTSVYWSPFPEKIPALTEPVSELTSEEKDILSRISLFDMPLAITPQPTATEGATLNVPKTNPFGF